MTTTRTGRRSRAASSSTCSSRRVECPSARMTSFGESSVSSGVEEVFWGVAVKPGKPLSFGVRGETLVFGLPGNPVSSLVACALFVAPAIEALQGAAEPGPRFEWGRLAAAHVSRDLHRDVLLRARRKRRRGRHIARARPGTGEPHDHARRRSERACARTPRRGDAPRRLAPSSTSGSRRRDAIVSPPRGVTLIGFA